MQQFLVNAAALITQLFQNIVDTISSIVNFITHAVTSLTSVVEIATPGMLAVKSMILATPAPVLTVLAGCICIMLVLAVIKLFT
jgi:hypothetical protein